MTTLLKRGEVDTKTGPCGSRKRCEEPDDERTANVHDKVPRKGTLSLSEKLTRRVPSNARNCPLVDYKRGHSLR